EDVFPGPHEVLVRNLKPRQPHHTLGKGVGRDPPALELREQPGKTAVDQHIAKRRPRHRHPAGEPLADPEIIEVAYDVPEIEDQRWLAHRAFPNDEKKRLTKKNTKSHERIQGEESALEELAKVCQADRGSRATESATRQSPLVFRVISCFLWL